MSEKLGAKKKQELMLATLTGEGNEQWALVELYRWQFGELPKMGEAQPLSVKTAVMKMAESFTQPDPEKWPAPMNIASVLAYLSNRMVKSDTEKFTAPPTPTIPV